MSFVRSSKFRHVFGTPFKREKCYDGVRITKSPHDSNMCAVNGKFLAVVLEAQGGGAFLVAPLSKVGRFDLNYPKVCGHRSLVLDVAWNPFNDNQIASGSEDCTVKLWDIPDEGLKENLTECVVDLVGHQKKVSQILWHPCAENVLASVGYDHIIIIWNTGTGEELSKIDVHVHPDIIFCMSWNYNGSLIATTCKDKKIRVVDPRKGEVVTEGSGHAGNKPSRIVFCGATNKLFTTGFSRSSERQYALWDAGNLGKALNMTKIDDGIGVMFPHWDEGTHMVYVSGKGDQKVVYFEITEESPYVFFLNMYQSSQPVRGAACMPKRHVEYMHCEVMRFYNLITKGQGLIEPVSMTVPRKSDMFQEDIFPPCPSGEPALSAEEWAGGQDKDPKLLAFTSGGLETTSKGPKSAVLKVTAAPKKAEPAPKTVSVSSKPPSVQRQSSGTTGSGRSSRDTTPPIGTHEPKTLEEYRKAYRELVKENFHLYRKAYKELEEENRRLRERLGI